MRARVLGGSLFLVMVAALAAASAVAAVYKWTDADGVVHYDDQNLASGQVITRDDVKRQRVREVPDWAGVVPADFAHQIESHCSELQERLAAYRAARQLYGRDPHGSVYRLSAPQARALLASSAAEADRYCAPDAPRRLYLAQRPANR